jgi:hypothetical protein
VGNYRIAKGLTRFAAVGDRCHQAAAAETQASLIQLQAKDEPKTVLDVFEELASYPTGEFHQEIPIDSDDLGHVRNRVFRQACGLSRQQDAAWGIEEAGVGAQDYGNDSVQATPVEGIALHNQDGPVVSRLRAVGLAEIGPPDLTALDYHVSRASDRLCRRRSERGSRLSSDP